MVLDEIGYDKIVKELKDKASAAAQPTGAPAASGGPSGSDDGNDRASGRAGAKSPPPPFESRLARPLDRLASAMADLVLFTPVLALIVAPLRRQSLLAQMLGHEADWTVSIVTSLVAGLLTFILYQTLFISIWGATPGKRVFGLRVESIWDGKKPRPLYAFVRAVAWACEVLFLGTPFIAVYGNEKRRPFHDRLADTVVVAHRANVPGAGLPTLPELTLASGFTAATLGVFAVVAISGIARLRGEFHDSSSVAAEMEQKGLLCTSVGEAKDHWTPTDSNHAGREQKAESRLAVALALFGAESLDETCLQMEADYAIWRNEEKTTAYLAEALAHADDENLYGSYLDKTCELEAKSYACGIAHVLRHDAMSEDEVADTEEKAERVADEQWIEEMSQTSDISTPSYFRVWMIRRLMDQGRYGESLARLDEISPHRSMGYFYARERMRALWNLDRRSEARLAMRSSIEALEPERRVEMAQWLCFNEASAEGCTDDTRFACNVLRAAVDHEDRWFESPEIVATYVRGETCRGELNDQRLGELQERLPEGQGKTYLEGLAHLRKNERPRAVEIFKQIAAEKQSNETFFVEANLQLAELASHPADLDKVKAAWLQMQPGELWRYFGLRLSDRFGALQAWNESLSIGLRLIESDRSDRQVYKNLVVAAYRSGNARMASGFLASLRALEGSEEGPLHNFGIAGNTSVSGTTGVASSEPGSRAEDPSRAGHRAPASLSTTRIDDFTQVSQELSKRGGN